MRKKIVALLEQNKISKKAMNDNNYRTVIFACGSLALNLAYVVFNGVLGIINRSFWFITLFAYYAILSCMRFYVVRFELKGKNKQTEKKLFRFCGWCLCFLAIVISGVVCLNILDRRITKRPEIIMIIIATYTFWKVITAIINIVRAHKEKHGTVIVLRNINCADAAMSVLSLEHSMISTFGEDAAMFMYIMDGAVGAGAFLIVFGIGISMIVKNQSK